jgi:hypothetical protein
MKATIKNRLNKLTKMKRQPTAQQQQDKQRSKNISHMNLIIEEYMQLDQINTELLFKPDGETKQIINNKVISCLAYNNVRLKPNVMKAIEKERAHNDDFGMIKHQGLHYLKAELSNLDKKFGEKVQEMMSTSQQVCRESPRELFAKLNDEQQNLLLDRMERKILRWQGQKYLHTLNQ